VGVCLSKATHATRSFTAQTARQNGASVDGTKALGGWNENGSFRPCYDRALPLDALLGAATFNARKPESYFLPRNVLGESPFTRFILRAHITSADPPQELLQQIFPWIEQEQAALEARSAADLNSRDFALKHFLTLLQWFRRVLIQDAAVLSTSHRELPIFSFAPFNTPVFHVFAESSTAIMAQAEEDARLALHNLPENIAHSFRGMIAGVTLEQQRVYSAQNREIARLSESVNRMVGIVEMERGSKKHRRRKAQQGLAPGLCTRSFFSDSKCRCCAAIGTPPKHKRGFSPINTTVMRGSGATTFARGGSFTPTTYKCRQLACRSRHC
jgi:hypothetical protein